MLPNSMRYTGWQVGKGLVGVWVGGGAGRPPERLQIRELQIRACMVQQCCNASAAAASELPLVGPSMRVVCVTDCKPNC